MKNNWLTNNNKQIKYYLKSNDVILVGRKYQIDLLLKLIEHYKKNENCLFLDFGCGDGIISKIILSKFPNNHIDLLDGSAAMIEKVKSTFPKGTNIIKMNFQEWIEQNIEIKYDMIFSSMAIHHLDNFQKFKLYSKIFLALKYNGLFVNMDVVKPISKKIEEIHFKMWENSILDKLNNNLEDFKKHQNITSVYKNKPENKPSTLISQLNMLENIGFEDVDCHHKDGIFAMFSGVKN
jgi:tRNA (cmo5U34)-methyltransferase